MMTTGEKIDQGLESLPRVVSLIWPLDETTEDEARLGRELNGQLLDRLNSGWASGRSSYRAAPFLTDTHPTAGWQDPRSPRDFASALLSLLDTRAREIAGRPFRDLDDTTAEAILRSVIAGGPGRLPSAEASTGFGIVRQLIYDILFSDTWDRPAIGWDWLNRNLPLLGRA